MTPIDEYLSDVEPAKRKALQRIRMLAKKMVPGAEETISYAMPTLKYRGKPFLGFNAHKNHIGIYPYSGETIRLLKERLARYECSTGAIRVPLDDPIPEALLRAVVRTRLKLINEQVSRRA